MAVAVVTGRALDAARLLTAACLVVECSFGTWEFRGKVGIQWTVVSKGTQLRYHCFVLTEIA